MAGDWLKMTHVLPDKPEVLAMAQELGITRFEVVGRLHIVWRWFDTQTDDGHAKSVTYVTLASCLFGDEVGTRFVNSLKNVGWLIEDEHGITVKNFDYHISESAKTRAQSSNRKKKQRENEVTKVSRSGRDKSVTREEKRREEVNTKGFDEFWSAYPKKVGKGAAEKAFSKAKVNGHLPEVLKAIEVQKRSPNWQKENGQYIPNPATWISQRRWEDGEVQVSSNDIFAGGV